MARPTINTVEKLEIQVRKSLNHQHALNIVLHPTYSRSGLPPKSEFIADVIDKAGSSIPFTESGFLAPGNRFVLYADVKRVHWISKEVEEKAKNKRDHFDRLEFDLSDGTTLFLKDLDQAVFPLLKFFEWLQKE